MIGGSSFGSIVAATAALQWSWKETMDGLRRFIVDRGSQIDYTVPAVSLAGGKRIIGGLQLAFGDADIESLWLRYFAVASNITRGEVEVHTSGPVWQALRSSISIPGVYAPVRSHTGDVLIDGALMNNLPVDVMRVLSDGGPVLAVSLRGELDMPSSDLPVDGVVSGWSAAWRRINPFASRPELPSILEVLLRATESGSAVSARTMEAEADAVLQPPVRDFALMDFDRLDDIADAGYRYTMGRLEDDPGLVELLTGDRGSTTVDR
jgi:NTE family protein